MLAGAVREPCGSRAGAVREPCRSRAGAVREPCGSRTFCRSFELFDELFVELFVELFDELFVKLFGSTKAVRLAKSNEIPALEIFVKFQ